MCYLLIWFSIIIWKLWTLNYSPWDNFNQYAHGAVSSMHAYKLEVVDYRLYYGFMEGQARLFEGYDSLFCDSTLGLLEKESVSKLCCLYWVAQDRLWQDEGLGP